MKELSNVYREVGQQFIDDLFKDYLVVTEKLAGSSFSFEKEGDDIKFYKSNDKPINLIDRTLMVYYENAVNYIKTATAKTLSDIPENWKFCFQYFVHNQPGVINYDNLPKNNLVLTHIQIKSPSGKIGKIIEDPRVINDWATTLNVTPLLPIFKGYLTESQKQKILDFIQTPREDHEELFNTTSFASYIINILNSTATSTLLQSDLTKPIESIIFKFYKPGTTQTFSAKLIDPYTVSLMKNKSPIDLRRVPADINEILLLDILAFIEERGLRKGEILSSTTDERYLELISNIFNDYVIRKGSQLNNIDIEKADFIKGDEFKLNVDFIPSENVKTIIRDNERLQDLFKIMLGSLRKKRNPEKTGNVLTPTVVEDFNSLIDKIKELTTTEVNNEFKTFNDYLTLKSIDEHVQNADELIVEERAINYNNFINLNKITLDNTEDMKFLKTYDSYNESKISKSKRSDLWINAYKSFSKIKDFVKPSHPTELLRANFGPNDGTAETEIRNFLQTLGIEQKNYTIERVPVGTFVPSMRGNISGDYDSYEVTIISPTNDIIGSTYKKGDVFYITNRYKISKKTGARAIIGKKSLTPDAMNLPLAEYKNATALFSAVESFVKTTSYPENYKNFILQSTQSVMTNTRNSESFDDFEIYVSSGKTGVSYDIPSSLFDGIDQISINNFANDYGEVLGGFMLFNILKDTGAGLRYPTASNERLVDFYFDNYSVSSKAGKKGGTPTGDTLIQKIYSLYSQGNLTFDSIEETDFLNNVVKPWVSPPTLSSSSTYNNIMNLCNINITDKSNSGYWYLVSEVNVQPTQLTEAAVIKHFDELYKNEEKFREVLTTLWDKSGMAWDRNKLDEYTDKYLVLKKKIGPMFYPLMVEIAKDLNNKYKSQLTKYARMVTDIKQLYLSVNVKRGMFTFNTVPFTSANFEFEQKGSIPKPFNANLGIKIKQ
jgi:hypothetical protein